jgi:hypothetical protein
MEQDAILQSVETKIFSVRGIQVMLDSDLARLYGTETKLINRAVKRNMDRFPASFSFQLTEEEAKVLRFQTGTLKDSLTPMSRSRGQHRKYLPTVFSEHGVAMLSAVLRTRVAVQVSIQIMSAFVELRRKLGQSTMLLQRMEGLEMRQIVQENKINHVLEALGKELPDQKGIFYNDQIFDAYVFFSDLIKRAKKSIVLIDNYIDETTLLQLSKRGKRVSCMVYTERLTTALQLDLEKHNSQYAPIEIRLLKHVHDRFLLIDEKHMYHLGASLKDLGKRWFAFSRMDGLIKDIQSRLE